MEKLAEHLLNCEKQNECTIEMPTGDNNIVQFKNFNKQLSVPFVIYSDLECILKEPSKQFSRSTNTKSYQEHEPCSIGYYFSCLYDKSKSYYRSNRAPGCIDWFVNELRQIANFVEPILNNTKPMIITAKQEAEFNRADHCHICEEKYTMDDIRVRDHSHLTGQYRGSAHSDCNLQYQESSYIPVIFHNLSKYDAHFIIKRLATLHDGDISVLPLNDQLYISFTKVFNSTEHTKYTKYIKFRFIDSFRFMASSLDALSSLLPPTKKKILHSEYQHIDSTKIQMLERKGVFCYDYLDSWEKLEETTLPSKDDFYSKLSESDISEEEYDFAQNVWNAFNIKTLGEYSDLYMKIDVLLLADVFENFRETCHRNYKLDPAHYFTAPGLSWDAMLKYTKVKIELLVDIDMLLFVERGIRGGISQCSLRHAQANNKYMPQYDNTKDSSYLIYLDANNLYGWSMMQFLPITDFEWCDEFFDTETILNLPDDANKGYIFEVDLIYPKELHDQHKDYPLCAEHATVPGTKKEKKLLLTLFDKNNYVIHYRMLKFVLKQGMKLKKTHRVLKFTQSQWLKPYIELNTSLRMKATNDFDKNFYKLLINANFGKTIENKRAQVDIRMKTKWEGKSGARKLIALPNFKKFNIFDKDLVAIHLNKVNILMDKPISVGMSVLDISKVLMYEFYYDHIQRKYGKNVQMLYTDTDSFVLEVKTDCFYSDMRGTIEMYDTSDFPAVNVYNIPHHNKKVPGKFKDELNGRIMTEFVGLRSKMYAIRVDNEDKIKKAKGIKKYVLNKKISFADYLNCIKENCTVIKSQNTFQSKKHEVFSVNQKKIALSPMDNKRYIRENNIDTLPWGHYSIRE